MPDQRIHAIKPRAADGKTLEAKIRNLTRYVQKAASVWVGSQAEYEQWAEKAVAGCLVTLSRQVYVD